VKYIGIDGCRSGWFMVGLNEDGSGSFGILGRILELAEYLPEAGTVLIDIPVGLRGKHPGERLCDKQARSVLAPKRGASVFPAPCRSALESEDYAEASNRNRECTGRGLTRQTYAIIPKIREVDQFLGQSEFRVKVHEMHPEVCFWALNDREPMKHKKRSPEGYEERLSVLTRYYPGARRIVDLAMQRYTRTEVARDDIVDALVGAVTAKCAQSLSRFPDDPEIDDEGLPMEIVYWGPWKRGPGQGAIS
jgi:predicted RNase H-like nuclease